MNTRCETPAKWISSECEVRWQEEEREWNTEPLSRLNTKTVFPGIDISIIKMRIKIIEGGELFTSLQWNATCSRNPFSLKVGTFSTQIISLLMAWRCKEPGVNSRGIGLVYWELFSNCLFNNNNIHGNIQRRWYHMWNNMTWWRRALKRLTGSLWRESTDDWWTPFLENSSTALGDVSVNRRIAGDLRRHIAHVTSLHLASRQIRKIAGSGCAGNAGNVFPATAG